MVPLIPANLARGLSSELAVEMLLSGGDGFSSLVAGVRSPGNELGCGGGKPRGLSSPGSM